MEMLLVLVLAVGFLGSLLLNWATNVLPAKELHRRTRWLANRDLSAKRIHDFKLLGLASQLFVWLVGTAAVTVLIIGSAKISYWLGALTVGFINLAIFSHHRLGRTHGWLWWLAGILAAGTGWLLHFGEPLFAKLPKTSPNKNNSRQLYETEDLLELLKNQAEQVDNRIDKRDLQIARSALKFSSKKVASLNVPFAKVRIVLPDEAIGPHLLDELYETGRSSFPVGKKIGKNLPPEIEAVVYIDNLMQKTNQQTVSHVMVRQVPKIDDQRSLDEALRIFLKYHSQLLLVKNEREEPVGVLWLEDVLEKLLGEKIEFDKAAIADADSRAIPNSKE